MTRFFKRPPNEYQARFIVREAKMRKVLYRLLYDTVSESERTLGENGKLIRVLPCPDLDDTEIRYLLKRLLK